MATKTNTKVKNKEKEYEYYRVTRTIGHEIVDGKKVPIKKQFYGRSKTEAENRYDDWKDEQLRLKYEKEAEEEKEKKQPLQFRRNKRALLCFLQEAYVRNTYHEDLCLRYQGEGSSAFL